MILVFDIGSGSVRAGLVSADGAYSTPWTPKPGLPVTVGNGMRHHIDLDVLMEAVAELLEGALRYCRNLHIELEAITCTAVRYAFVLQGDHGPVASWANSDRSSAALVPSLRENDHRDVALATGGHLTSLSTRSRLALAGRELERAPKGRLMMVPLHAWVLMELGAGPHCDISSASDTRMVDLSSSTWSESPNNVVLPPIVSPGDVLGYMDGEKSGGGEVALVAGCGDSYAAFAAFTDAEPGDIVIIAGTTTPVLRLLAGPDEDLSAAFIASRNGVADDIVSLGISVTSAGGRVLLAERNVGRSGHVISWISKLVGTELDELECEAGHASSRSDFSCHLGPSIVSPGELGNPAMARSLELGHASVSLPSRSALYRSAVEANAWATAYHISELFRLSVPYTKDESRVIVLGGQAQSTIYLEALASALRRPVFGIQGEASLVGAGLIAKKASSQERNTFSENGRTVQWRPTDAPERCAAWIRRQSELATWQTPGNLNYQSETLVEGME